LEDGLKLDLNKLIRDGLARPGCHCRASICWTRTRDGAEVASARIAVNMIGEADGWLSLEIDGRRREIALQSRPRHFGGRQWYFVCPSRRCLVSVLWRPYGARVFANRQAWGRRVAYGSQFEAPNDRAITRGQNLRRRLGGAPSLYELYPEKPKGMRWRTYDAIIKAIERNEIICEQYLEGVLGRFRR